MFGKRGRVRNRVGTGDDVPPSGEEASAQRKQTVMPLVWLVLGAALAALFVILLATLSPLQPSPDARPTKPSPASTTAPPSRGDVETTTGLPPQNGAAPPDKK
jgi:hypothetical protein